MNESIAASAFHSQRQDGHRSQPKKMLEKETLFTTNKSDVVNQDDRDPPKSSFSVGKEFYIPEVYYYLF